MKVVIIAALLLVSESLGSKSNLGAGDPYVTIGSQVWMTRNLDVDHFANGDIIPMAEVEDWKTAAENKRPAWCYYANDPANGKVYGRLYNWYAVSDPRGLAPKGWHVPTNKEWETLVRNVGGVANAGMMLKKETGWEFYRGNSGAGSNAFSFSALPAGYRTLHEGMVKSHFLGYIGAWWTSTGHDDYPGLKEEVSGPPGNRVYSLVKDSIGSTSVLTFKKKFFEGIDR